ncbi:hypothetical protein H6784_02570 [Candidatus Nomurabacteria bacterium]|nr:hypothetical protein [Candidatus Kaiserbacteria bacterium]MCB9814281.1 hypothetical protein [Candidatus Nomurabacteria bacterium]
MSQWSPQIPPRPNGENSKLLNKTFYKFLFSFVAVVATVLVIILITGVSTT